MTIDQSSCQHEEDADIDVMAIDESSIPDQADDSINQKSTELSSFPDLYDNNSVSIMASEPSSFQQQGDEFDNLIREVFGDLEDPFLEYLPDVMVAAADEPTSPRGRATHRPNEAPAQRRQPSLREDRPSRSRPLIASSSPAPRLSGIFESVHSAVIHDELEQRQREQQELHRLEGRRTLRTEELLQQQQQQQQERVIRANAGVKQAPRGRLFPSPSRQPPRLSGLFESVYSTVVHEELEEMQEQLKRRALGPESRRLDPQERLDNLHQQQEELRGETEMPTALASPGALLVLGLGSEQQRGEDAAGVSAPADKKNAETGPATRNAPRQSYRAVWQPASTRGRQAAPWSLNESPQPNHRLDRDRSHSFESSTSLTLTDTTDLDSVIKEDRRESSSTKSVRFSDGPTASSKKGQSKYSHDDYGSRFLTEQSPRLGDVETSRVARIRRKAARSCTLCLLVFLCSVLPLTTILIVFPLENETNSEAVDSSLYCGCPSCTTDVWHRPFYEIHKSEATTCGQAIEQVYTQHNVDFPTKNRACEYVAETMYPAECGACNPWQCAGEGNPNTPDETDLPNVWWSDWETTNSTSSDCAQVPATTYQLWGSLVEVQDDSLCTLTPGQDGVRKSNVQVLPDVRQELRLSYSNATSSQVLLKRPRDLPYGYGSFVLEVGAVQVASAENPEEVLSSTLPEGLALRLVVGDGSESAQVVRTASAAGDMYFGSLPVNDDTTESVYWGDNGLAGTYSIEWKPTWLALIAQTPQERVHFFSVDDKPERPLACPSRETEVRLELVRLTYPSASLPTDYQAQVTIRDFRYVPASEQGLQSGDTCNQDCQCWGETNLCVGQRCVLV